MRVSAFRPIFVDAVPERLEQGTLYVSLKYKTVIHMCACGCGSEVVTPLGPTDWKLSQHGGFVSLHPSVGSWNLPCRSHYWIRRNAVVWAMPWSDDMVAAARMREREIKDSFYAEQPKPGFWKSLWNWIMGK